MRAGPAGKYLDKHDSCLPFALPASLSLLAAISLSWLLLQSAVNAQDNSTQVLKGPISSTAESDAIKEKAPAQAVPAQNQNSTVANQKEAGSPLSEVIANVELRVEPKDMVIKGKHGIRIHVKNNTDRALVFNGEMAYARVGETVISCMDIRDFDELFAAPETFASNLTIGARETITSALSVGSCQTVRDMFKSSAPGLRRYGRDEERREQDEGRFGQRVLWPGDSSSGIVLFPCEQSLAGAVLTVPVASFFNSKEKAAVTSSPGKPKGL